MQFSEWILTLIAIVATSCFGGAVTWALRSIRAEMAAARAEQLAALSAFQTLMMERIDGPEGFVRKSICGVLHRDVQTNVVRIERIEKRLDIVEQNMRDVLDDAREMMKETLRAIKAMTALITGSEEVES